MIFSIASRERCRKKFFLNRATEKSFSEWNNGGEGSERLQGMLTNWLAIAGGKSMLPWELRWAGDLVLDVIGPGGRISVLRLKLKVGRSTLGEVLFIKFYMLKNQYSVFRSIVFPLYTHIHTERHSKHYTFRIRTEMLCFLFGMKWNKVKKALVVGVERETKNKNVKITLGIFKWKARPGSTSGLR